MKKRILLLSILLAAIASPVFAGVGGQTLQKNMSPRAEGVGLAYTALADDVYAIYWNPAALSYLRRSELSAAFSSGLSDDYYAHISYANAADAFHTWGLGFLYYSSGPFEYVDEYGQSSMLSNVKSDWLLTYSNAYRFNPWWRFGFTFELFHSTLLEKYNATTLAVIVSSSVQFENGVRVDAALKHLGFPLSYGEENDVLGVPFGSETTREALPLTFSLGVSYDVLQSLNSDNHELVVAGELNKVLEDPYRYNVGLEYRFFKKFALRAGYQLNHENNWLALGAGLAYPLKPNMDLKLDYAFSFSELLNDQHKISLSFLNQITDARQDGAQVLELNSGQGLRKTMFKIGLGVGRDFGGAGINFEGMATDAVGLYLGVGTLELLYNEFKGAPPKACLGTRIYFGPPESVFRGKLSFSISNGILATRPYYYSYYYPYYGDYHYEVFPEIGVDFGFQWRIFEVLSLDLSAGIAAGYLASGYSANGVVLSPAINAGLHFNIPQVKLKK